MKKKLRPDERRFIIITDSITHLDDYENGELASVNTSYDKQIVIAKSVGDAVKKYFDGNSYMAFDKLKLEDISVYHLDNGDEDGQNILEFSIQITESSYAPTEHEIELWKQGKFKLFSESIRMYINEIVSVTLTKDWYVG